MEDDDLVVRAYGDLLMALNPLPPGLDWDYYRQDPWTSDDAELGDSPLMEESPAIDAVYDWGNPLIVEGDPLIGCDDGGGTCGQGSEQYDLCERPPVAAGAVVSGGDRFRGLVRQLRARGVRNPAALAAWIGRRKYGARRFAQMAEAGRRRAR